MGSAESSCQGACVAGLEDGQTTENTGKKDEEKKKSQMLGPAVCVFPRGSAPDFQVEPLGGRGQAARSGKTAIGT